MFNTLESYHFQKLPQSFKDKAEKMIDDVCPLGILYEGTIDAVEVWGRDDILLLMQAMYNEAIKEESKRKDALLEWAKNLKDRWEEPPMSKHSPGCVYMLEQVIKKLNSM